MTTQKPAIEFLLISNFVPDYFLEASCENLLTASLIFSSRCAGEPI